MNSLIFSSANKTFLKGNVSGSIVFDAFIARLFKNDIKNEQFRWFTDSRTRHVQRTVHEKNMTKKHNMIITHSNLTSRLSKNCPSY
jgi:hypothetical protein